MSTLETVKIIAGCVVAAPCALLLIAAAVAGVVGIQWGGAEGRHAHSQSRPKMVQRSTTGSIRLGAVRA